MVNRGPYDPFGNVTCPYGNVTCPYGNVTCPYGNVTCPYGYVYTRQGYHYSAKQQEAARVRARVRARGSPYRSRDADVADEVRDE